MKNIKLFAILICLTGQVIAQNESKQTVKSSIPSLLMLELEGNSSSNEKSVPITIDVTEEGYQISPNKTELRIQANSDWVLSASYQTISKQDSIKLQLKPEHKSQWTSLERYSKKILQGKKSSGWQSYVFEYGLASPLAAKGNYQGLITYSLAHP